MPTATGFDFEPQPDGNVLIEFFGDDGHTINEQIVTADLISRLPVVAALMDVAMRMGPEAAAEFVERMNHHTKDKSQCQTFSSYQTRHLLIRRGPILAATLSLGTTSVLTT